MTDHITGYPQLTPDQKQAAQHLLFYYGAPGGLQPGRFHILLIKTMEAADYHNRARLLRAFPEFEPAVTIAQFHGINTLAKVIAETTRPTYEKETDTE